MQISFKKIVLIYEINVFLTSFFFLLIYTFCGRGLRGRAGCRQTEVQTKSRSYAKELANKQTDEVSDLRQELAN